MGIRIRADSVKYCLHLHLDSIMLITHIYLLEKIKDHTPALLRGGCSIARGREPEAFHKQESEKKRGKSISTKYLLYYIFLFYSLFHVYLIKKCNLA